jgi:hypothetical protein
VIKMNMSNDQGLNTRDIEADGRSLGAWLCIGCLLEPAVDQEADGGIEVELVAGAGDAPGTTMMGKGGKFHTAARSPRLKSEARITSLRRSHA